MILTPKQERFAQEVASGKSQTEAYRIAFNVRPTTKPESVQVSACKLMAEPKVTQRVQELREEVAKLREKSSEVETLTEKYEKLERRFAELQRFVDWKYETFDVESSSSHSDFSRFKE